jgi:hypothetical protein
MASASGRLLLQVRIFMPIVAGLRVPRPDARAERPGL